MKTINFSQRGKDGILGLQHLVAMFGATTLVPILTGLDVTVALLTAGLGTLLFHFITKKKVPIFLGSSFAFIPPIIAIMNTEGKAYVQGGIIVAGLLYVLFALLAYLIGAERIRQILPPHVTGSMIIIIGLSLIPTAINMSSTGWLFALVSFGTALAIMLKGEGFFSQLSVLTAIAVGYLSVYINKGIDFTPISSAKIIVPPPISFPAFSLSSIMIISPIVLATLMEHLGDIATNQAIVGKDFYSDPGLHRTLLGDGLATVLAGTLGGPVNTTYSENTAVLKLTKNYDPRILRIAAVFAIFLSFFGKVGGFFETIPTSVLGGVSLILFWMIAKTGIDLIAKNKRRLGNYERFVIIIMLFFGLGSIVTKPLFGISLSWNPIPSITIGGASFAATLGIVLTILKRIYRNF